MKQKKLKKVIKILLDDISIRNMGWGYFFGRAFINIVLLWIILQFLHSWIVFSFSAVGATGQEFAHIGELIATAGGLIFLIVRLVTIPILRKVK